MQIYNVKFYKSHSTHEVRVSEVKASAWIKAKGKCKTKTKDTDSAEVTAGVATTSWSGILAREKK